MESAANRLQKEAKGYLDSLRGQDYGRIMSRSYLEYRKLIARLVAMTASQMRIAETIDAFYGDAGANDGVSRSYKQAVEDLDAETIKALDGPFRYLLISQNKERRRVGTQTFTDKLSSNLYHASAPTSPT